MTMIVATQQGLWVVEPASGAVRRGRGLEGVTVSCVAWDSLLPNRAWAGTVRSGVFRSDDGGATWGPIGLDDTRITSITASMAEPGEVWVGTEPSSVWHSEDGGESWRATRALDELPSSKSWAFPPRPDTHHVRWIACHPEDPAALWVAIEAGALVSTRDGGASWNDRVPSGPTDTHELAIHPERSRWLRAAAGDGYFESQDGGATWASPEKGLDVGYFRSIAIDPGDPSVLLLSGASGPRSTYRAGASDGRVFRREGDGRWERVLKGWPDLPTTIAPILRAGPAAGDLRAVDERGVHQSADGGRSWRVVAEFPHAPSALLGVALRGSR